RALALVTGASDRDFPAELHQVDIDGAAAMTKSNRQRDVSVRLNSHHPGIGGTFTANLADKILAFQFQHAHEKVSTTSFACATAVSSNFSICSASSRRFSINSLSPRL